MSKLGKNLVTLARQAGGSFKTVADRMRIASRIAQSMLNLNIQIRDVNHIKIRHIEIYIQSRLAENLSKRTLQNEMSAIRAIFAVAGRTKLADPHHPQLSNAALGLSGASREGTKTAISDARYQAVLAAVKSKDEGVAAAIQLARYLGLRTEEAVQSVKSLRTWQRELLCGKDQVRVVFGTKGGRPRNTTVIDREKVISVISNALKIAHDRNGRLIDKPSLHMAIDRYRNMVKDAGLIGKNAPHSLRYAYSQELTKHYIQKGFSQKEAEAMVSMDLGHGDGRGAYVARVYNKN